MTAARRGRRNRPPRVVLDTNVLLSALVFSGGALARLQGLWQSGAIVPLVSTTTAEELVRVLAYPKFKLDPGARQELLADHLPWAEVVEIASPPPPVPACRDPFDLPFLYLAASGRAEALVTGDADLLSIADGKARTVRSFVIVRPHDFLASLAGA